MVTAQGKTEPIIKWANTLLCGYAAILFTESPRVGLMFLLATFWFPNIGSAGLVAALMAIAIEQLLKFRSLNGGQHIYNSLLVGLSLGANYQMDGSLLLLLFLATSLTVFLCAILSEWLWRTERLPILSVPFVIVAFMAAFAAQGYGQLDRYLPPVPDYEVFLLAPVDYFLTALGSTFFIAEPRAGLLLFLGILVTSRYLALLGIGGFMVGNTVHGLLFGQWYSALTAHSGFNFILTAMALGGIFTVSSRYSFILAMLGASLAAIIAAAMQSVLLIYGLPVLIVPFLITTLTLLAGLNRRQTTAAPQLLLDNPALPEVSMERVRLAKARGLGNSILTLTAPFLGEWTVYQGMEGEYTHQAPWQHALDFIITDENGKSYQTSGEFLEDYYSFGLPVLSPVYGQVSSCCDYLPDNPIGEVDTQNNWGNYVLIWVDYQHYVLIAHLQQHSLQLKAGDWVYVGQKIAQCGNTGRSPQPHIHLHVQQTAYLGSPTVDFVLSNLVIKSRQQRQFYLTVLPTKNDAVSALLAESKLATALHFPVGKQFCYQFRKNSQAWQTHCFTVTLTLIGQFRLQADSGASVAFVETDKVLAFYDRNNIPDPCLDLLVLNLGLTPLVNGPLHWRDEPAASLLPLPKLQKWLYRFLPFGHRLHCDYQRQWQTEADGWLQTSVLSYGCYWHKKQTFQAQALIVPELGCVKISLELDGDVFEASLKSCGRVDDIGIPSSKNFSGVTAV